MAEGFTGEGLNILIGSAPYADDGKDRVKLAVMSLLNDMYGITGGGLPLGRACRRARVRRVRDRT